MMSVQEVYISTDFKDSGTNLRLLSLAWACEIATHEDYEHRSVPVSNQREFAKNGRIALRCGSCEQL